MANNIIKISDLMAEQESEKESNSSANTKERFAHAKEVAQKEMQLLEEVIGAFGKKACERYAICELIDFNDMLNTWFETILESIIRPMVDGGQYTTNDPTIDFKTMRYDFYSELADVVEKHENNNKNE